MPTWAKVLLILVVLSAVSLMTCAYCVRKKFTELGDTWNQATEDGKSFGASATMQKCQDEAFRRSDACGENPLCLAELTPFVTSCLEATPRDTGFCQGVPPIQDNQAFETWTRQRCQQLGQPESPNCYMVLASVSNACTGPGPKP